MTRWRTSDRVGGGRGGAAHSSVAGRVDCLSAIPVPYPAPRRTWRGGPRSEVREDETDLQTAKPEACEQARISGTNEDPWRSQDLGAPPSAGTRQAHCEGGLEIGRPWATPRPSAQRPMGTGSRSPAGSASEVKYGCCSARETASVLPASTCSPDPRSQVPRDTERSCPATADRRWTATFCEDD